MKRTAAVVVALFLMILSACTGTDVQFPDGDTPDGDTSDGDQSDGDLPDGDLPDGDVPDGDKIDGDKLDGDKIDGDGLDGDVIDGDAPSCPECDDFTGTYCVESFTQSACPDGFEEFGQIMAGARLTVTEGAAACTFSLNLQVDSTTEPGRASVQGCDFSTLGFWSEGAIDDLPHYPAGYDGAKGEITIGWTGCELTFTKACDQPDGDVDDDGDSEIDGDVVDGDSEIDGDVEVDGDVIDGDIEIDGDVEVDGDVIDGDSEVDGDAIDGDSEIDGDVVDGDGEIDGDVIDGDIEIDGDLVDGDEDIEHVCACANDLDCPDGYYCEFYPDEPGCGIGCSPIEDGDVVDGDEDTHWCTCYDDNDCSDGYYCQFYPGEPGCGISCVLIEDGDVVDADEEIDDDVIDADDEIEDDVIDGDDEAPVEICDNGIDDDDDDLADCEDPDCQGAVSEPGACTNDPDLGIIADTDMLTVLQACVISQSCAGDAQCNSACVSSRTGLSTGCSDCFGGAAACLVNYCFLNCLDPQSAACADCLATNCLPTFEDCFGSFYCPWEYSCVDGLDNDSDGLIDEDDPECSIEDGDIVDGDAIDGDLVDGDEGCPECDAFSGTYCPEPSEGPYCDLIPIVSIFVAEVTPCQFEATAVLGDSSTISVVSDGCGFTDLPVEQAGCTATHNLETGQLIVDCPGVCSYVTSQDACTVDGDVIDGDIVDGDVIDGDDEIDGDTAEELACGNAIDDDGNGLTDCQDPSCFDAVASPGSCTNPEDRAIEVTIDDLSVLFQICMVNQGCGSNVTCNTECTATQTGLSNGCSGCYGEMMGCTYTNCLFACLDPSALTCTQCVEQNCFLDFSLCHGQFYCTQETSCNDDYDNDSDALTDCQDPDCSGTAACQ